MVPSKKTSEPGWCAGRKPRMDGAQIVDFLTKPEIRFPKGNGTRDQEVLLGNLNHYARGGSFALE
jgi:hypothetical protein